MDLFLTRMDRTPFISTILYIENSQLPIRKSYFLSNSTGIEISSNSSNISILTFDLGTTK